MRNYTSLTMDIKLELCSKFPSTSKERLHASPFKASEAFTIGCGIGLCDVVGPIPDAPGPKPEVPIVGNCCQEGTISCLLEGHDVMAPFCKIGYSY